FSAMARRYQSPRPTVNALALPSADAVRRRGSRDTQMDFDLSDNERRFRDELRAWLDENLPAEWRSVHPKEPWTDERRALARRWQARLAEGRYVALDWPVEWGGRDA